MEQLSPIAPSLTDHRTDEVTVQIGTTRARRVRRLIILKAHDRLHHVYLVGKTGTGKSTLLQNAVLQDIVAGHGCCFMDPHGESIDWILERIPPHRVEDVVLFDPSDVEMPLGLNLLEWQTETEKDFLVSEAIQIFYKLFDPESQGVIGPQFEHWMRNAALTVMADPQGGTLIEIPRLFTDRHFELRKRRFVTDPVVNVFWDEQMEKTSDFHRSEMLNYFSSKFGRFMTNTAIRNVIGQPQSAFRFSDIMDRRRILLVNLSKGKTGEMNAAMLGLILTAKLHTAAMQRATVPPVARIPFYVYIDEFQNLMTNTFVGLLSEVRKYGVALHLANQYVAQLSEDVRSAVLGNARTLIAFQVGADDAAILLREFEPATDPEAARINLETFQYLLPHHYLIRLSLDGITYPPFEGESLLPLGINTPLGADDVRTVSRLRFGKPRALVEAEFAERYRA
jgi:type IV secretory pathway TraG/TraD family ATPase VirD4